MESHGKWWSRAWSRSWWPPSGTSAGRCSPNSSATRLTCWPQSTKTLLALRLSLQHGGATHERVGAYGPFAGSWYHHGFTLEVTAGGNVFAVYRLYAWCGAQQRFGSTAVIAWETAVTGAPQREPGEDIQMWTLPAEAVERARRGEVGSAPYALVLFLADPHLRARGFL